MSSTDSTTFYNSLQVLSLSLSLDFGNLPSSHVLIDLPLPMWKLSIIQLYEQLKASYVVNPKEIMVELADLFEINTHKTKGSNSVIEIIKKIPQFLSQK